MKNLIMNRIWEMLNKWTFKMRCIQELFSRLMREDEVWIDPFAGQFSSATYRNDIEENRNITHNMDALDFLKSFQDESVDGVLFDPPYSPDQCLRHYTPKFKGMAGKAEYWAKCKDQIARIVKQNGMAISFCWDSTGIGKKRGFMIREILLICHGACHNDTVVTIDFKR